MVFEAGPGIPVVATGDGKAVLVTDDEVYGKIVVVEHGNGYQSVYRTGGEAKVKQGDEITKGETLFEISDDHPKLGYQITLNDVYINPLDTMEIYG